MTFYTALTELERRRSLYNGNCAERTALTAPGNPLRQSIFIHLQGLPASFIKGGVSLELFILALSRAQLVHTGPLLLRRTGVAVTRHLQVKREWCPEINSTASGCPCLITISK